MSSVLSLWALLAYLLMFVGLIGSVLPLVPGPVFIWLGALVWAANDGFQAVGWPTLLFLGLLTVLAWSSDLPYWAVSPAASSLADGFRSWARWWPRFWAP